MRADSSSAHVRNAFLLFLVLCPAGLLLFPAPSPAQIFKDSEARDSVEALRLRLNEVEAALQVRQMGLGEQIQTIREDIARLDSMIEENRRGSAQLGQRLEATRIETQEALVQLNVDYQERFRVIDENMSRLLKGIEDLQKNVRTLSENIQAMSEFERQQEERISLLQGQLQNQLREQIGVVVDEVSRENSMIRSEISALRGQLSGVVEAVNTLDGRLRDLSGQVQEVSRRQERMASRPPSAAGGQHVVQSGETLSIISQRYGTTVRAIMEANGIADPNLIRAGQVLDIP